MRVLVLWSDLPSPYCGWSLNAFHMMKHLSKKHEFTLIAFRDATDERRYTDDLLRYCHNLRTLDVSRRKPFLRLAYQLATNALSPKTPLSRKWFALLNFSFSPAMRREVENILATNEFDVIYTNMRMAHYVKDVPLPKVVHNLDCMTEAVRQFFVNASNPGMKLLRAIQYLKTKQYERTIPGKFDACIVLSPHDQGTLNSLCPKANIVLIPIGVDTQFFRPWNGQEEWPSLIFVGDMEHPPNIDAVLFFYNNIYKKIKEYLPKTKLYIVGRNPVREVCRLSLDKSVIVTGYVEDVRPYLSRSSIAIAPLVSGTGIKIKILEAMAMGKLVISTSVGSRGIDVSPGKNILIADDPQYFAKCTVEALFDETARQTMGHNGRLLVKAKYSWDAMADELDTLFRDIVKKHSRKQG